MSDSQTLVVKLGTSVLTGGSRRLNRAHIVELVRQCAQLHAMGHRIVIVTSGAIAAGREHLGYPELPATIASKQLLAAVGQSRLIQLWEQLFSIYGIHVGQMLLTRADMEDRERFLNARDTRARCWITISCRSLMKMTPWRPPRLKSAITIIFRRWRRFSPAPINCCC
jgi:glutamate 5-kinase